VGALTEKEFRFKARVWYLSSAPSVCNGCSTGCNIDVHFVLDRPHLNDGARVLRLKPRTNPDVNQWWMCDEGRFGFHGIDRHRLLRVLHQGQDSTWEKALSAIGTELTKLKFGVLASTQLTTEELFLVREVFQDRLNARVAAFALNPSGKSDDFLLDADRNPNARGAKLLGLGDDGAGAGIVKDALDGRLDALWIFGHDLTRTVEERKLRELSQKLKLFVFSGTSESPTGSFAHWVLPTAAYVEKDGTFVNKKGRIQRIGLAFPPLPDSREDWSVLLEISRRMGNPLAWNNPQQIFLGLAAKERAFKDLTYDAIGSSGTELKTP
jgi:NADH-quinone oxidoreductase subunit G